MLRQFKKLASHEKVGEFKRGLQMFLTLEVSELKFEKWTQNPKRAEEFVRLAVGALDRSY